MKHVMVGTRKGEKTINWPWVIVQSTLIVVVVIGLNLCFWAFMYATSIGETTASVLIESVTANLSDFSKLRGSLMGGLGTSIGIAVAGIGASRKLPMDKLEPLD